MKFSDIEFVPHPNDLSGVQGLVFFPNGYGASIIRNSFSYGREEGKWELAVVTGSSRETMCLNYDTPITGDVIGYLTEEDVLNTLDQIAELPPTGT